MNWKTPQAVVDTIRAGDEVEQVRGLNRVKINDTANGVPPLTDEEAEKMHLHVNCNFNEMAVLFAHARRQYVNAFMRPSRFFHVTIPSAPVEYQLEWEQFITHFINRKMKKSRPYFYLKQNQFASLVAHGIGTQMWWNRDSWLSCYIAVEDLRVPTDSEISTDNWEWFAIRKLYTEGQLGDAVFGQYSDKSWNKKVISKILKAYHNKNFEANEYDWVSAPEKMAEYNKQNLGYYSSDAVPTIPLWNFYFRQRDKQRNQRWSLRVVPDLGVQGVEGTDIEFLAQKDTWATDIGQILHVQYGDLNNKTPHLYHSVRSLGFLLMEPTFWSNMLNCRFLQHVFESFNIWLRVSNPSDKQRPQKVEMYDQAVIPEGVTVIPQQERHQIDAKLVEAAKGYMRQLQSEAAASYTQQPDNGTAREQTAYETAVKMAQVNAMMSGLLLVAFFQETFAYNEICRRFCLKGTRDPDAKKFQEKAKELGIPPAYLDVDLWDVEPEIPLGAGQPVMEIAQAGQLMANREKYPPTAQQEILHDFTAAVTGNFQRADRLVPLGDKPPVSNATQNAVAQFGALMQGVPVPDAEEYNPIDQIEAFLGMLGTKIAQIEKTTNMATPEQLQGMANVADHIRKLIARLAQNPQEKQRVRQYMDQLGGLENMLKAFAQRLQEQQKQQQGQNGDNGKGAETAAKIRSQMFLAESNARVKEAKAAQGMRHKEQSFQSDQARKDASTLGEMTRKNATAAADIAVKRATAFSKPKNNES